MTTLAATGVSTPTLLDPSHCAAPLPLSPDDVSTTRAPQAPHVSGVPRSSWASPAMALTQQQRAEEALRACLGLTLDDLPAPSMHVHVAVAGGGLGGLALAVGLGLRGVRAHVFEAAPRLRTDSGTCFVVARNCKTALEGIRPGLAEELCMKGSELQTSRRWLRTAPGAPGLVSTVPGTFFGEGAHSVPWAVAQQTLAAQLEEGQVHCHLRLVTFRPLPEGGVDVIFRRECHEQCCCAGTTHSSICDSCTNTGSRSSTSPGSSNGCAVADACPALTQADSRGSKAVVVRAQLLVGADGMRSRVRATLVGDKTRYVRVLNWNCLVPNANNEKFLGNEPGEIVNFRDEAAGLAWMFLDAGPGLTCWNVGLTDPDLSLAQGLDSSFGGFGAKGVKQRVLGLLEDRVGEAMKEGGKGEEEALLQRLRQAIEATDEAVIYERKMEDRAPLDSWSDKSKRVVLLGDAAHGLFPGPGQGAQMTFEDAHQLAEILSEVPWSQEVELQGPLEAAIGQYEAVRVRRCARVQGFAAEVSALPEEETKTEEVRKLSFAEYRQRMSEFIVWVSKYPKSPCGDTESTYWK